MAPRKHVDKMADGHKRMFGEAPKQTVLSPLEKGDHPELDDSDFLDEKGIRQYHSLLGSMQWAVSLAHLNIAMAVMTLASFCPMPRIGHLDRAKQVVGFLAKMKHGVLRFRTAEPDFSDLPEQDFDWAHSVCGDVEEMKDDSVPPPLGACAQLCHCVDANLCHDLVTGRSVTGILHFANQTLLDWCTKKQAAVETAMCGSEFVAS